MRLLLRLSSVLSGQERKGRSALQPRELSPCSTRCSLRPADVLPCPPSALKSAFSVPVRPRKTARAKQGVLPAAARPGRRPGKKPHPARKSRPKAPPVDDAEVEELVSDSRPPRGGRSVPAPAPGVRPATGGPPPSGGGACRQPAAPAPPRSSYVRHPPLRPRTSSPRVHRQPVTR